MGRSIENLKTVTPVGVDLAKNVIQTHAIGANGEAVGARGLRRRAARRRSLLMTSGRLRRGVNCREHIADRSRANLE